MEDGTSTWAYDKNGNRTSVQTGTGNRVTSDGTWDYTYDDEGNVIQKEKTSGLTDVWNYTYNHFNQLTKAEHEYWVDVPDPGADYPVYLRVEFKYDVLGNRIEKATYATLGSGGTPTSVVKFAYDPLGNAWADLDASGNLTTRRLYLDAVDAVFAKMGSSGSESWYLTDRLGSVRDMVNSSGTLTNHIDYGSYGAVAYESSADGDRYRYTGRELDADLGLQYNRARYYQIDVGRWMSEDPLRFAAGDANLYRYVQNSPVNLGDPSGLKAADESFASDPKAEHRRDVADKRRRREESRPPERIGPGTRIPPVPAQVIVEEVLRRELTLGGERTLEERYVTVIPEQPGYTVGTLTHGYPGTDPSGLLLALAEFAASLIPGVGEGMDVATMLDPNEEWWIRVLAGGSLLLSAVTFGTSPNVGSAVRAADHAVDALSHNTDNVVRTVTGGGCFPPDTVVGTETGLRRIADVGAGDYVWSYDFNNGTWELCEVLGRRDLEYQGPIVTIDVGIEEITATALHPFWVIEGADLQHRPVVGEFDRGEDGGKSLRGRWVNSNDLQVGDVVFLRGSGSSTIRRIWERHENTTVCNLTIRHLHTFAVGEAQVLVHNTGACSRVPLQGIYEFADEAADGITYVGQSGNIEARIGQHLADGRVTDDTVVTVTEVLGGRTEREIAEHIRIQEITGGVPASQSSDVSNLRDPIGPDRKHLLPPK